MIQPLRGTELLQAGQVRVAVAAVGQLRDVVAALGMYPGQAPPLGAERRRGGNETGQK